MSAPIDVLAVMDADARDAMSLRGVVTGEGTEHTQRQESDEARAAVSNLILALRETTAAIGYLNRAYPAGLAGAWQRNDAFDMAKAALSRIGFAP